MTARARIGPWGLGFRRPRRASAFTLLELLVVMAIIAILLGLGAGLMAQSKKGLGFRSGVTLVLSSLRFARAKAMTDHAPCWLLLDPKEGTVRTLCRETIGLWHLEDGDEKRPVTTGAFGRDGKVQGGEPAPGRAGRGFFFGAGGWIDCGDVARNPTDRGFALEAWCLAEERRPMTILAKEGEYGLRLTGTGAVRFSVGDQKVESKTAVPLHRWFHLEAIFDGESAALYLNDDPVADEELKLEVPITANPLTISAEKDPFRGVLDEVRVWVLVYGESQHLPADCELDAADLVGIRFDPQGRIAAPATITLKSGEESRTLSVGLLGTVE